MDTKLKINCITYLLLAFLLINLLGCQSLLKGNEQITITDDKSYIIEPSTILQSLAQGDEGAFVLMTATPPVYPPFASETVQWIQSDYFFVSEALSLYPMNQSLEDWKLTKMFFRVGCHEISSGFQNAGFKYFKTVDLQDTISRLEQVISINPNENIVSITDVEYTLELVRWESIDLTKVEVTADDALQIAEENGGAKVRSEVGDSCAVLAFFEAGGKYEGWLVTYFSNGSLFDINIDPQTGEFKVFQ